MFLIAFLSFVGAAIQFVCMPLEGGREGTLLPHLLFALAGIRHYRTLLLAWLALQPLGDGFGLTGAASLLGELLGGAAFVGWTIVASVCHRLG